MLRVFVGLEVLGSSSPLDHSHTACCTSHLHCALALRIRVLHLRLAFARRSCIAFCRSCLFSRFACHACIAHFMLLLHCAFARRDYASHSRVTLPLCRACVSSRLRFVALTRCCAHALSIVCRTCIAHSHVMFVVCTRMLHLHIAR